LSQITVLVRLPPGTCSYAPVELSNNQTSRT